MFLHRALFGFFIGVLLAVFTLRVSTYNDTTVLLSLVLLILIAFRWKRMWWAVFMSAGFYAGTARCLPILKGYDYLDSFKNQKVELLGTISNDPAYHESGQYEFLISRVSLEGKDVNATLKVRSFTNDVRRGDRVEVTGKLRDGFAYWQGSIYFAETTILQRDDGIINRFRQKFIAEMYTAVPDPEASLGLGFLIGLRTTLPEDLNNQLSATGLTHIVAVSGYNLTILVGLARQLFARRSRFQSLIFSVFFLFLFIAVTGMSPSILRATIVSLVSLLSWYYGRRASAVTSILASSAISAYINPAYAWFDVGWYLSLAAFIGILMLAPLITKRLYAVRTPGLIGQLIIETSCAQVLTLPIILLVFGKTSAIALVANALILPIVPLCMLVTAALGLTVFIIPPISGLIATFAYWLLGYVTSIVQLLAQLPWAIIEVEISTAQLLYLYCLIVSIGLLLMKSTSGAMKDNLLQ